jgi:hypothetical protein
MLLKSALKSDSTLNVSMSSTARRSTSRRAAA